MVVEALKTEKKINLAIDAVAKAKNLSPATVWTAWGTKKNTPKK